MKLRERLFARAEPLNVAGAGRVLWSLLAFLAVAWSWATWAQLQEQIRAPATVIVSSRSQVVQAVDGGVLMKLYVREGDVVQAGDLLAELDPARFQASAQEIRSKVVTLRANIQRLEAEMSGEPLKFSDDVKKATDIVESMRRLHARRLQLQSEEISAIGRSLEFAKQELEAIVNLTKTGDASQSELIKAQRAVNELQGALDNKRNGYRQEAQSELAKARGEIEQAEQVLNQRREALQSTKLYAPMTGTVNNVKATTIGAVLRSGDELLQIVPSDDPLLIEAKVKPADVAFVRKDLKANVKLDAYDYTVYGSLRGHVTYISPDTLQENTQRGEVTYYRVHIQIDEVPDQHTKKIEVLPGMTASAEIITGERSVAQYLLKPLRRVSSEALVER